MKKRANTSTIKCAKTDEKSQKRARSHQENLIQDDHFSEGKHTQEEERHEQIEMTAEYLENEREINEMSAESFKERFASFDDKVRLL